MNHDKLNQVLEGIKEQIKSAPEELRGEVFAEALSDIWGEDVGKAMSVINLSKDRVIYHRTMSEDYKEKKYLTRELHEWLYLKVLETGVSTKEAIELAAEAFTVTVDSLDEARKSRHSKNRMQEVVSKFDTHPVQRGLMDKGVMTKKELYKHNTPTGQLTRLGKGVKLFNVLKDLESRVSCTEEEIRNTKATVGMVVAEVNILNKLNATGISKGQKITICKENDLTQKEAAELLNVSVSTIKRGWNE